MHEKNSKEWFKNADIEGGVNYFLKDSSYEGPCIFNGVEYDLSKYDSVLDTKYHDIIDRVSKLKSVNSIYIGRYFGIETNDKNLKTSGSIKCYVSKNKSKDRIMYLDTYDFNEKNTFWKVITPEANGKKSSFGAKFIGKPDEIHTGS